MDTLSVTNNFLLLCEGSNTEVVKDYYNKNPSISLETNNYEALRIFCLNGNLLVT